MKFTGVGVALVTPFHPDGSIDFPSLESLINKVIAGGVDFLVALGTTAETPTLSAEEKRQVLEYIIAKNERRKPLVVGIGGNDTRNVIDTIQSYSHYPIDGILSVVPYYNKPSQEGIYQHFAAIAQATDLPIILYNVPGRTVTSMLAATTIRLANDYKNLVAVKEASGNLSQCMDLLQHAPAGFAVLSGDDNLTLAQMSIGMHGVISVAANSFPATFSSMVHAALADNMKEARSLHYQLLQAMDLLFEEGNPAGVKYVLTRQGVMDNNLRLPLIPVSKSLADRLNAFVSIQ